MKRFYLIAMAIFSALSISAETSIQNTFFGCTLGKSTSKEVQAAMAAQGFQLLDTHMNKMDSIWGIEVYEYNYKGQYNHEGKEFHSLCISFYNDTFYSVLFEDSCLTENCSNLTMHTQTNLEQKYGSLEIADSILHNSTIKEVDIACGIKRWSKQDKSTIIETILWYEDKKFLCRYTDKKIYCNIENIEKQVFNRIFGVGNDLNYSEENKVYGVAGVKFGDDKETVHRIIAPKSDRLLDSDTNTLEYYKTRVGGTTYQYANFCFIQGKLATAFFDQPFALWEKEEALMFLQSIKSQYEKKYSNMRTITEEDNEKVYACGAYIDDYNYLPIIIQFKKAMNQGNKIMYYVFVSYYQMRTNNLYNDEI